MNIQQMQYILAVAEHKHFETAAEKCFVTQSTLSTMISKLEDELGVKIFDRKKKPVTITNEGKVVIEQLKVIVSNINQLQEQVKELKGEVRGRLSIAVIPTVAPFLLPLFLQDFAKQFPDLNIEVKELTTQEIIRQIKSRELDMGILSIPVHENELIEVKLYDEPFVLYDAGLKNKNGQALKKMDLSNLWLMEEGHCMRTQVMNLCDTNKKQINSNLNFDFKAGSIDSLLRFVKANKATTLLPYLATTQFTESEKNCVKNIGAPIPLRTIGIVVNRHFVKKKVLDLLVESIISKVECVMSIKNKNGRVIPPL